MVKMLLIQSIVTTLMIIALVECNVFAVNNNENDTSNEDFNTNCPCIVITSCLSLPKAMNASENSNDCPERTFVRCCAKAEADQQDDSESLLEQTSNVKNNLEVTSLVNETASTLNREDSKTKYNLIDNDILEERNLENIPEIIIVYPNRMSGGISRSLKIFSNRDVMNAGDQKVFLVYPEQNGNSSKSKMEEDDSDILVAASSNVENVNITHTFPLLDARKNTNADDVVLTVNVHSMQLKARNVTEAVRKSEINAESGVNTNRRKYRRRKLQRKFNVRNNTSQDINQKRRMETITLKVLRNNSTDNKNKTNYTKLLTMNSTSNPGEIVHNAVNIDSKQLLLNNTKADKSYSAHNIFVNTRRAELFKERNRKKANAVLDSQEMHQNNNFSSVDGVHRLIIEHMRGSILSTSDQKELSLWPEFSTHRSNSESAEGIKRQRNITSHIKHVSLNSMEEKVND